jgi:hypothetical protein
LNSGAGKDEKVSYVYMPKNVQSTEETGNTLKPPGAKAKNDS